MSLACTAVTRSGRRCENLAWWDGGCCPRHFDPAWTFGDWIAGYANGLGWRHSLPHFRAILVLVDGQWPHGLRPNAPQFTVMLTHAQSIPTDPATGIRPNLSNPRIGVCFGTHGSSSWKSVRPRCGADAETAQVQIDEALALGRIREGDEFHDRVLRRFYEVVADATRVAEALADGDPLQDISTVTFGSP